MYDYMTICIYIFIHTYIIMCMHNYEYMFGFQSEFRGASTCKRFKQNIVEFLWPACMFCIALESESKLRPMKLDTLW